jgi:hypothetical protein
MNYWVRFWIVILSLITSIAALAFLSLSFVFPDAALFDAAGSAGRLLVTLVGAIALGIVIWSSATFGDVVSENPPGRERG